MISGNFGVQVRVKFGVLGFEQKLQGIRSQRKVYLCKTT